MENLENTEIVETKKDKGKNVIIGLLFIIIIILGTLVILFATGTITLNTNNNDDKKNTNETSKIKYQEYTKGQIVTLSDTSKWLVLADSDKNNDAVKLMSIDNFVFNEKSEYWSCENQGVDKHIYCSEDGNLSRAVFDEFFNGNITTYKGTSIDSLVNSFASLIPATLKEVDGYKIRLLSISDLMEYDNNWKKDTDKRYIYTGNSFNKAFDGTFLMDVVDLKYQCNNNCGRFYSVGEELDYYFDESGYYVETGKIVNSIIQGHTGIPSIRPVIYAYKDSI